MKAQDFPYQLLICDFDNTLTTSSSGSKFPQGVADRRWMPNRLETLLEFRSFGIKTAIATNQGGAAFGYFQPREFDTVLARYANEAKMTCCSVCYEHPNGRVAALTSDSPRRKPNPGMLLEIMNTLNVAADDTLYVGDREEDREAARRAQVAFMWAHEFFEDNAGW